MRSQPRNRTPQSPNLYIGICKKLVKNLATGWSLVDMENSGIFKTMKRQWNIPFIEL